MGDWTPPEQRFSNLHLRLLSAAILIPLGLSFVWIGSWWLAIGCAAFAGVMAWEWWRMNGSGHPVALPAATALICLSLPIGIVWIPITIWLAFSAYFATTAAKGSAHRLTAPLGLLYVAAMAASLWLLREGPWDGKAATLYFMSFVWASDAAAYFTGRGLGGRRLLPAESPNKTWSGAVGAMIICAVCGLAAADVESADMIGWMIVAVLVSIVSQLGDLFESGLKRRFGVKDSSRLLPGHGGVLDRVDGLGAVSIIAVIGLNCLQGLPVLLGIAK